MIVESHAVQTAIDWMLFNLMNGVLCCSSKSYEVNVRNGKRLACKERTF
jgi:hypothetical protein